LRNGPKSFSSITFGTQPLGRHLTNRHGDIDIVELQAQPEGSSTPKGATTRISLLFWFGGL